MDNIRKMGALPWLSIQQPQVKSVLYYAGALGADENYVQIQEEKESA